MVRDVHLQSYYHSNDMILGQVKLNTSWWYLNESKRRQHALNFNKIFNSALGKFSAMLHGFSCCYPSSICR